jgi:hypothetical protein
MVSSHWGRRKKQLLQILPHSKSKIQNLKLLLFPHSRFFAFIRGSITLYKSRRCGAAAPYRVKKQDFKIQEKR